MSIRALVAYSESDAVGEADVRHALKGYYILSRFKTVKTSDPQTLIKVTKVGDDFKAWVLFNSEPIAAVLFVAKYIPELRHPYEPHAFVAKEFRGRGVVTMVYTWFLRTGATLVTNSHTKGARKVWDKLNTRFKGAYLDPRTRRFSPNSGGAYRVLFGKKASVVK